MEALLSGSRVLVVDVSDIISTLRLKLPDSLPPLEPFHLEHIVDRQHGGKTETENLAWACHRCNYCIASEITSRARAPASRRSLQ
jgi:HNH endonuclease